MNKGDGGFVQLNEPNRRSFIQKGDNQNGPNKKILSL